MIELWHMPRSRSLRVLWALEEMGLPYRLQPVTFLQPSEEFIAMNPARTVPVMRDGSAVISESIAILLYLASRYGPTPLVVQPEERAYADYLQFLLLGEAGLAAPLNALDGTQFFAPEDQRRNVTTGIIVNGLTNRLKLVEAQLADGREFLAMDRFTLADISVAWATGTALSVLKLGDKIPPNVQAHHARVTARPAYLKAAAQA